VTGTSQNGDGNDTLNDELGGKLGDACEGEEGGDDDISPQVSKSISNITGRCFREARAPLSSPAVRDPSPRNPAACWRRHLSRSKGRGSTTVAEMPDSAPR
jgi:hypothetical protein